MLFGPEGVGKSTFASKAPNPIFLCGENGTSQLAVTRFQQPDNWVDVYDAITTLIDSPHDFKTLVIDTLDWIEPLLWAHICQRDGKTDIEAYGYAKGYVAALDEWRLFVSRLERLRDRKGMNILFLAHSWIRPYKNPRGEDYDRFELKLHTKAGGLFKEWCDAVLFADFETVVDKDQKTKRVRGISTGARFIYTVRTAAYDAKSRYGLPERLPLDWDDFAKAVAAHTPEDPTALQEAIRVKAKTIGGEIETKALQTLAEFGSNAVDLARLNTRLNAILTEKGQDNG